jgi:glucan biosynthesis protein C
MAQMAFSVLHSIGLLVLFRDIINITPGKLGKRVLDATYAAYILHPCVIIPLTIAFASVEISLILKFLIVSVLSIPILWFISILVKFIPGIHRIL